MRKLLNGLSVLGAKPLLPPLLSAYKVGNLNDKRAFLANLMTLYVRHVVIGGLEGSRLETFLYDLARRLRQDRSFGAARTSMIRFAPDDGGFAAAFRVASVSRGTAARYLLREIEYNRRRRGEEVQINDLPSVSLEHIYPQNPIAGTWADYERWVHRLGNLTIMSRRLNSGLRNGAFAAKIAVYGQSDILITRELDAENSWNQAAVDRRQDRMLADANVIWRFI